VSDFRIEPASEADVPLLLRMIHALAEYEGLAHDVVATEEGMRQALFGDHPFAEAVIGYAGAEPVGFALFFHNFSTFRGAPGMYLEDLFVEPAWRGRGFGQRLFAHVAAVAVARGCYRMEWSVLDWNQPAIAFYRRAGALPMDEWTVFRLTGGTLKSLAASASGSP
jgi:GNAT superfamily N-acetyltransferase